MKKKLVMKKIARHNQFNNHFPIYCTAALCNLWLRVANQCDKIWPISTVNQTSFCRALDRSINQFPVVSNSFPSSNNFNVFPVSSNNQMKYCAVPNIVLLLNSCGECNRKLDLGWFGLFCLHFWSLHKIWI